MGKCPDCGAWDSLEEYKPPTPDARRDALHGRLPQATQSGDLVHGADPLKLTRRLHAEVGGGGRQLVNQQEPSGRDELQCRHAALA